MQSHNNRAILAAAGSRKTQYIVDAVRADKSRQVLVTTYTNENTQQLIARISGGSGVLPKNVTVMPWFTFLLNQCARPYQAVLLGEVGYARGLNFVGQRSRFTRKTDPKRYYLDSNRDFFRNELAAFAFEANELSGGCVISRVSAMYDHIYVDEVQDLAGYDLHLVEALLESPTAITVVGDPRQATFATNNANKNKQFKGSGIAKWLNDRKNICEIESRTESHRCNQAICDFADGLYPDLMPTESKNKDITGHDGIFAITPSEVASYVEKYSPRVLRHNRKTNTQGLDALNFGESKGLTFDRVLIFPTQPMIKYYKTRDLALVKDRSKFYVAVTRARYSVTFVIP